MSVLDLFKLDSKTALVTGARRRIAVVFLASAASDYVSGSILVVDGGCLGR